MQGINEVEEKLMNREKDNTNKAFEGVAAKPSPEKPEEKLAKRHGDDLQSVVDKATGRDNKPH